MEEITERPLFALEEQLVRQRGILANSNLLQKLPDRGAKLRDSVAKIEVELERRRQDVLNGSKQGESTVPDVANLEWVLRTASLSADQSSTQEGSQEKSSESKKLAEQLDSDDDMEEENVQNKGDEESTFKLIATSQITQRQAKPVIDDDSSSLIHHDGVPHTTIKHPDAMIDVKPDPYLVKLVEKDVRKGSQHHSKFVPGKSLNPGSTSSALTAKVPSSISNSSGTKSKWDEALLPLKSDFEQVKMLSMEDTIKISCDKYKQAEETKATAPPKKSYAYDRLKDQGLLGSYTVEMQTSRPVRTDVEEDDDEDDLSDDSITEESESEDSDGSAKQPNQNKNEAKLNSRQKTSKDLSNLLNASLKLS